MHAQSCLNHRKLLLQLVSVSHDIKSILSGMWSRPYPTFCDDGADSFMHSQSILTLCMRSLTNWNTWQVVAEKDLDAGEDLFLNYGPLSNDILLLDYGFVLPNNPNDRVELRYDGQLLDTAYLVAKGDSLCSFKHPARWQQDLLERLKLHGPGSSQSVPPFSLSNALWQCKRFNCTYAICLLIFWPGWFCWSSNTSIQIRIIGPPN